MCLLVTIKIHSTLKMKSIGSYFQVNSKDMNIKLSAIVNRQVKPNDIIVIDDSSADEKDIEDECRVDGESVQYLKDDSQEIYNLSAETKMEPMTENPFIQFAHGLGASESSYFSTSAPLPGTARRCWPRSRWPSAGTPTSRPIATAKPRQIFKLSSR